MTTRSIPKTRAAVLLIGGFVFAMAASGAQAGHHPVYSPKPSPFPVTKTWPGGGNGPEHCNWSPTHPCVPHG
jgi:hypothetical protein